MEPTKQIDVMVADASHEVYVDTILEKQPKFAVRVLPNVHTNT
jgi:hypothetical protein